MPIEIQYLERLPHVRVTLHGLCEHADIIAAMHTFLPDPRTHELRDVLWDVRDAHVDCTPWELREQIQLLGRYRRRHGWGLTIAVTPNASECKQSRQAAAYAAMDNFEERIQVCRSMEEAMAMFEDIQQRFKHHELARGGHFFGRAAMDPALLGESAYRTAA